jgi:hypothetical protein
MSDNICPTIVLRPKNPIITKREINPDSTEKKIIHTTTNSQSTPMLNAKKLEERIESGDMSGPPKIPRELGQKIQSTRIEKGFATQKSLIQAITKTPITSTEIQQMENGSFILNGPNKQKLQAVCVKLGIKSSEFIKK